MVALVLAVTSQLCWSTAGYTCAYGPRQTWRPGNGTVFFAPHVGIARSTSSGSFTGDRNLLVVRCINDGMCERIGQIHWHSLDFDEAIFFIDEEANFMKRVISPSEYDLFCTVVQKKNHMSILGDV